MLALAASYPVLAARAKIQDRFDPSLPRTLDGSAFMGSAVAHENEEEIPLAPDGEAIRWVLENVDGTRVFAEANTAPVLYGWESRYAVFTGNPTDRAMWMLIGGAILAVMGLVGLLRGSRRS